MALMATVTRLSSAGEHAAAEFFPAASSQRDPAAQQEQQPARPAASHDDPDPGARPVAFVVERIVVEGARRGSEKIVIAELLLTLGNAYTEGQLREALHRVRRLPFVVEADFALRKGSQRGRVELVVTVSEAWPVFFGGSLAAAGDDDACCDTQWFAVAAPQVGARLFFGGQNEIAASVVGFATTEPYGSSDLLYDVSYRHHDVFGRHVVGTLFLRTPQSLPRGYELGASLGVPLSRVSTVDASFLRNDVSYGWQCTWCELSAPVRSSTVTDRSVLAIRRDTTDDPFVARQGTRLQSELSYAVNHGVYSSPWAPFADPTTPVSPEPWVTDSTSREVGASIAGRRYWPLSPRTSLGLGLRLSGSLQSGDSAASSGEQALASSVEGRSGSLRLEGEVLRTLPGLSRGRAELWWSAKAGFGMSGNRIELESPNILLPYRETRNRYSNASLAFSLAARGRWGLAQLEFRWSHDFRPSYAQR
jgi:hypothetical protein